MAQQQRQLSHQQEEAGLLFHLPSTSKAAQIPKPALQGLHGAASLSSSSVMESKSSLCRRAWCSLELPPEPSLDTPLAGLRGRAGSPRGEERIHTETRTEEHVGCPDQRVGGAGGYQLPEEATSVLSTYGKLAWRERNPRGTWEFSNVWEIAAGKWKVFVKEIRRAEAEIPLVMAQTEERNSLAVLWKGASRGQDSKRKWSWVIAAPHNCWQLGESSEGAGHGKDQCLGSSESKIGEKWRLILVCPHRSTEPRYF